MVRRGDLTRARGPRHDIGRQDVRRRRKIGDVRDGDCAEQDESQDHDRVRVGHRRHYCRLAFRRHVNPTVRLKFRRSAGKSKALIHLRIMSPIQARGTLNLRFGSRALVDRRLRPSALCRNRREEMPSVRLRIGEIPIAGGRLHRAIACSASPPPLCPRARENTRMRSSAADAPCPPLPIIPRYRSSLICLPLHTGTLQPATFPEHNRRPRDQFTSWLRNRRGRQEAACDGTVEVPILHIGPGSTCAASRCRRQPAAHSSRCARDPRTATGVVAAA